MLVKDNKYIPQEDKDFFILLRIGLWQKVEEPLSPLPDWPYIYRLSCEQTVQGIVADGVAIYKVQHPDLQITQEQNDQFLSATAQIVRRNYQINQLQARICQLFADNHIPYVVLKGQAVAQAYPKPMLRVSGDIDYFMDDENFAVARALLEPISDSKVGDHTNQKHVEFMFTENSGNAGQAIGVELHADEAYAIGKRDLFKPLLLDMLRSNHFRSYNCQGVNINLAPSTFDATYVFLHAYKHYLNEGLGMRQLCDLTMLIFKNQADIDLSQLRQNLKTLGLVDKWDWFISFIINYIGIPKEEAHIFSKESSPQNQLKIWNKAKQKGNFGHAEEKEVASKNFWGRNIFGFKQMHKKFFLKVQFAPSIAFRNLFSGYKMYLTGGYRKIFHIGGDSFRV